MKIKSIFWQKNLSFLLLVFLGFNYIVFVLMLTSKALPAFFMQLILLINVLKDNMGLVQLLASTDLYLGIIAGMITFFLWFQIVGSIYIAIVGYYKTRIALKALDYYKIDNVNIIKSSEEFVFTCGLLNPQIYISHKLLKVLTKEEYKVVIDHEKLHKKTFDPLRKFIVNFIYFSLPFFPGKKTLFENYDVLTELCADSYAEKKTSSRKSIISALNKMVEVNHSNFAYISAFNFKSDRIKILVGMELFKTRSFFTVLFIIIAFTFFNTLMIKNTSIFAQCKHIAECFQALLSNNGKIISQDKEVCLYTDDLTSKYHCVKFSEDHHSDNSTSSIMSVI